ncbi:MAG TPA: hypothetical protein VGC41_24065 [Kofleriaceae bacterium]
MRTWWSVVVVVAACGSKAPPPKPPPPVVVTKKPPPDRDEIVAAHRKLELEQQDALALACTEPAPHPQRCTPNCYPTEPVDPRATKKPSTIAHVVCGDSAPYVIVDELVVPKKLRAAKPHRKKSTEGVLEATLATELHVPKGDQVVVQGTWHAAQHPISKEPLRCIDVVHLAKHPIDGCGADGNLACEATGNQAARGINVVHFNLAVARELATSNDNEKCQQAALEAVAIARGLPRWRQYAKLNAGKWVEHPGYRTRFDGVLDEDSLFAIAGSLGHEAEQLYAQCGGGEPKTTAEQEQSFHGCW